MEILLMVLLMAYLMVKDTLLKDDLMRYGFGAPSDHSHYGLIEPFDPHVNVNGMVGMWYVYDGNGDYC